MFLFFITVAMCAFLIFPSSFDLVVLYKKSSLFGQAMELLKMIERQFPGHHRVRLERADVLYLRGQYGESDSILIKLTQDFPNNKDAWKQLVRGKKALLDKRQIVMAMEGLHKSDPADTHVLAEMTEYYSWLQMPNRLVATYKKLADLDPQNHYYWMTTSELYLQQGKYDEGIETLKIATRRFPESRDAIDLLTEALFILKRKPELAELYEQIIADDPHDSHALLNLAEIYIENENYSDAEKLIERTIDLYPESSRAKLCRAEIMVLERRPIAAGYLAGLYQEYPDDDDIVDRYVVALIQNGMPSRAKSVFHHAYSEKIGSDEYHLKYVDVFLRSGAETTAVSSLPYLKRWVQKRPANKPMYLLAQLFQKRKRRADALLLMRQLLMRQPSNPDYRKTYIEILYDEKMKEQALISTEKYVADYPDDIPMLERLADVYDWNKMYVEEFDVAERLLALAPLNPLYKQREGYVYYMMGKYKPSAEIFDGLTEQYPDTPEFRTGLIDAVEAMPKDKTAARYASQLFETWEYQDTRVVLLHTSILEAELRPYQADEIYGFLEVQHPKDADLMAKIGVTIFNAKDFNRAIPWFEKALELAPNNVAAAGGLSELLMEKDPERALELMYGIEKQQPQNDENIYRMATAWNA
ncbi:MAG: tetratricopeptide repeat protein, partial [Candidatus Lindowbacteria bacterium]|nr:tetratricopeptide repeat protein [Candidatus Lindowbacteria bacterium]